MLGHFKCLWERWHSIESYVISIFVLFIQSLQKKYDSNPEKYKDSFRVMLEEEIAANKKKKGTACVSLLWLKR